MSRDAHDKDWHGVRYVSELRREILEFARSKERRVRVHGEVLDLRQFGDVWYATLLDSQQPETLDVSFKAVHGTLRCGAMIAVDGVLEARNRPGEQSVYYRLRGDTCEVKHPIAARYRRRQACISELMNRFGDRRKQFGSSRVARFIVLTGQHSKARLDVERTFREHRTLAQFEYCDLRSPGDIAAKLTQLAAQVRPDEAIAVTRGGGAPLEIDVFDAPVVAKALMHATTVVPTLLAVGHAADELLIHQIASEVCYTPTHAGRRMSWLTRADVLRPVLVPPSPRAYGTTSAERSSVDGQPESGPMVPVDIPRSEARLWITIATFALGLLFGWWLHEFVL